MSHFDYESFLLRLRVAVQPEVSPVLTARSGQSPAELLVHSSSDIEAIKTHINIITPCTVVTLHCQTWNLEVAPGQRIKLSFQRFDIEADPDCAYDYVQVSSGSDEEKYCGTAKPSPIISSGNTMRVVFHSDRSVTRNGFKAAWKAVDN